jgi:hypothetical protein
MDNINTKNLLCFSIFKKIKCVYGDKCTYAHSLNEQNINPIRYLAYSIIMGNKLELLNEENKEDIYNELFILCNLCKKCIFGFCTGGINCKNGVFAKSLKICKNDFLTGECIQNTEYVQCDNYPDFFPDIEPKIIKKCCNGIHTSNYGITPFYKYKNSKIYDVQYNKILSEDDILENELELILCENLK